MSGAQDVTGLGAPYFWGEALQRTDEAARSSGAPPTTGDKSFPFS